MQSTTVRFSCPRCRARIKAPLQLGGHNRRCPGCGHGFTIPRPVLVDAEPVLVPLETQDHYALGITYRTAPGMRVGHPHYFKQTA